MDLKVAQTKSGKGAEDRKQGKKQKNANKIKPTVKNNGIKSSQIQETRMINNLQKKVKDKQNE